MKLILDAETQELQASTRQLIAKTAGTRPKHGSRPETDVPLWERLMRDFDITSLAVPVEFGGDGGGHIEQSVLAEELGRALVNTPFVPSTVLAVEVLTGLNRRGHANSAANELLSALVKGERVATFGVVGADGRWPAAGSTRWTAAESERWSVTGHAGLVLGGADTDVILVLASTHKSEWRWFAVDVDEGELGTGGNLDPTQNTTAFTASDRAATEVSSALTESEASSYLDTLLASAASVVASEALGGMKAVVDSTVAYAKMRYQFGRTIGSYQSIKHLCADMLCDLEQAEALIRHAAWAGDNEPESFELAALAACAYVLPRYFEAATQSILIHGGIGFTWEHDAHFYYKRAKSTEMIWNSAVWERLATLLGQRVVRTEIERSES